MKLSPDETKALLSYVATSRPDEIDCDGCFEHLAELVEHEVLGNEIPEALVNIQRHIDQCPCCSDEHNALLEGLRAMEEVEPNVRTTSQDGKLDF
ncbi:MAG: hypothetical protein AAGJ40_19035 [Planctomycetota bacterium]